MCGIWALFGYDSHDVELYKSAMSISRRGPDQFVLQNVDRRPEVLLGFHRLTINGEMTGMQPMRLSQYPHLFLIANSEVYNYEKLMKEHDFKFETDCDCEIILHLYNKFGAEEMPKYLDGVFGMCIVDTLKNQITIARDTYGVRPLFYSEVDGKLGICSEAKGLSPILKRDGKDLTASIKAYLPGHVSVYSFEKGKKPALVSQSKFHDFAENPAHFNKKELQLYGEHERSVVLQNINRLFTDAVEKRLMSGRRVGSLLSGGLDSSLVAALTARGLKKKGVEWPVQTFSIGLEESPDVLAARKVAHHIGSEHFEVSFTPEEGFEAVIHTIRACETFDVTTIRASTPMYLLAKYINTNTETVVIMSGEGADELAQGYIYFHKAPSPQEADKESKRLLEDLYLFDVLRTDRSTAAHGLEVRAPFLDHAFTSYYLSLPPHMRQPKDGVEKHLLRSAFEGDLIPSEILWRPKEAFSDGVSSKKKSWFEILQGYINERVTDEMMSAAAKKFPFRPPVTKEAYFYRDTFEQFYSPNMSHLIPYQWMPKWVDAKNDPSARVLTGLYKNDEKVQQNGH